MAEYYKDTEHFRKKVGKSQTVPTTDSYWYHGNGKLGGEFHPNKPNDEEHYGEYVKVVRCKDCKHLNKEEMRCFEVEGLGYRNVADDDFCSKGEQKDEVKGDVVPVRHGQWIFAQDETWYAEFQCSECGERFDDKSNYCPNCGADMRGEQK